MRRVAKAAGVSMETVCAGFGSKGDLLVAAMDVAVVGQPPAPKLPRSRRTPRVGERSVNDP